MDSQGTLHDLLEVSTTQSDYAPQPGYGVTTWQCSI